MEILKILFNFITSGFSNLLASVITSIGTIKGARIQSESNEKISNNNIKSQEKIHGINIVEQDIQEYLIQGLYKTLLTTNKSVLESIKKIYSMQVQNELETIKRFLKDTKSINHKNKVYNPNNGINYTLFAKILKGYLKEGINKKSTWLFDNMEEEIRAFKKDKHRTVTLSLIIEELKILPFFIDNYKNITNLDSKQIEKFNKCLTINTFEKIYEDGKGVKDLIENFSKIFKNKKKDEREELNQCNLYIVSVLNVLLENQC